MKRILVLLSLAPNTIDGQNLVPNHSFEDFTTCPGSYTRNKKEFKMLGWYSANEGTPDAYHECGIGEADVPYNWAGISEAYDGKGYVGIYAWLKYRNFREYIQCKLDQPLIKDSTYRLAFRYRLSSYSKFAVNRIGLLLSDSAVMMKHDRPWKIDPTLSVENDSALNPRTGLWESAFMEYKARGGERYLTIGNFATNEDTREYEIKHRPVQEPMLAEAAYYYIDNVMVRLKHDPTELTPVLAAFHREEIRLNERYILDNIHFEFNSYKLQARSFDQLDEVVALMKANPHYRVMIAGYTDDVGGDQYNLNLSVRRARTVATYLSQRGIEPKRIESAGFGKKHPLMEGTSEEIRQMNRRVELTFFQ